jgi:hypothetical protein
LVALNELLGKPEAPARKTPLPPAAALDGACSTPASTPAEAK